VKPAPFRYARAATLAQAVDTLAAAGEDARVLAGGQSLVPMLNFRLARPSVLVDVTGLREMQDVRRDGAALYVGAGVRQRTAELSPLVRELCPLLADGLRHVGHLQIRTRGTVGGSVAHADPAAEIPAIALALDATMDVVGPDGGRTIAAADFFYGPYWTALEPGEILTAVRFPIRAASFAGCREISRRHGDFAVAGLAAVIGNGGATTSDVALVAFGVGAIPVRLAQAEAALRGAALDGSAIAAAAQAAAEEIDPMDDGHGDADYRRRAIAALVSRFLEEARR
jgi:CO/xanthine dehydrogenase FAD-binding subunit